MEGQGILGVLDTCSVVVVDDDLYPKKILRTKKHHLPASERVRERERERERERQTDRQTDRERERERETERETERERERGR